MNRKKFYFIIILILVVFLVLVYFISRRAVRLGGNQATIRDITKIEYAQGIEGCLDLSSGTEGAKASISSNENSFSEVVELPVSKCVPVGKYLLSVYAKNYRSHQSDIIVSEGQSVSIKVDLEFIGQSEDEEKSNPAENF